MHSIGNFHDAQTILQWVRSHPVEYGRPSCVEDKSAPLGWEYVGKGSHRSVWRSPEGVVYKVGHHDGYNQCTEEITKLKEAWSIEAPEGVRLPRFNSFEVDGEVIPVMEAVEGTTLCRWSIKNRDNRSKYRQLMRLVEQKFRLRDMHDENCMVDLDGYLVPIDFGG